MVDLAKNFQERVQLTVQEQLARAEANELFKAGDLRGAVAAYQQALAVTVLGENRLPLLANLGLCHLRLAEPQAAREDLKESLALGVACYDNPGLALKAAGRLLEACDTLEDAGGSRAALAECRFYWSRCIEKSVAPPPSLRLPQPPMAACVEALLMAVGALGTVESSPLAAPPATSFAEVSECMGREVLAETLDEHRMHALALSIHVEGMQPTLSGKLLSFLLEGGTPVDARHEAGKTALMLAANNGRLDLCTLLLDAGAQVDSVDSAGFTPLICACVDLPLVAEKKEAGLQCDPAAVVSLLLERGANAAAVTTDGNSALQLCKRHEEHECAQRCRELVEQRLPTR